MAWSLPRGLEHFELGGDLIQLFHDPAIVLPGEPQVGVTLAMKPVEAPSRLFVPGADVLVAPFQFSKSFP